MYAQNQGYRQAHVQYGRTTNPHRNVGDDKLRADYRKALKSIVEILEKCTEYEESFIIQNILKIGEAYNLIQNDIQRWTQLKNIAEANKKNNELGIYMRIIKDLNIYVILCKFLSPIIGKTILIQIATLRTLSSLAWKANQFRISKWYKNKQCDIGLREFQINNNNYNCLLLLSHLLNINHNDLGFNSSNLKLQLICYSLKLLLNLTTHNNEIDIKIKQFGFLNIVLKILRILFDKTLIINNNNSNSIVFQTFLNGLHAILSMIEHNDANKLQWVELNGCDMICKCLRHNCYEIRLFSICFLNTICSNDNKIAKYVLNTKYNNQDLWKILLNCIQCIYNKKITKKYDNMLCQLIACMRSLCNNNLIGYRYFYKYNSWKIIRKLLESLNNLNDVSKTLNMQIFSLLSSFNIQSYEIWKIKQWNNIKNDIIINNDQTNNNNIKKKKRLTLKQKQIKQKKEDAIAQQEYKKYVRLVREIIKILGGQIISSTKSTSPQIATTAQDNKDDNDNDDDDDDESFNRDIILLYLFKSFSTSSYVLGSLCSISCLCKMKQNQNINRLDHIIEILKKENPKQYQLSLQGFKKKIDSFMKLSFKNMSDLQNLNYFICAAKDIINTIAIDNNNNNKNNKNNKSQIRSLFGVSSIIDLLCLIITSSFHQFKYNSHNLNQIQNQYNNNNNNDEYIKWSSIIKEIQLNACYSLGKLIQNDTLMQNKFGRYIPKINETLKQYAIDHVDRAESQIAITYVLQSGCFKPNNLANIKLLRNYNIEHMLNQLYKSTKIT